MKGVINWKFVSKMSWKGDGFFFVLLEVMFRNVITGCRMPSLICKDLLRPQASYAISLLPALFLWPTFECGSSSRVKHTHAHSYTQYNKGPKKGCSYCYRWARVCGCVFGLPLNYVHNMKTNKQTNKIRSWIDCCIAYFGAREQVPSPQLGDHKNLCGPSFMEEPGW